MQSPIATSQDAALAPAPLPLGALIAQRIADGSLPLPMLPEVAAQVALTASSADADAKKLAELVRRDPPLFANILKVVNSPMYAGRIPVTTLQQAILRLGLVQVREIAWALSFKTRLFTVLRFEHEVRACFRRSFAAACFAQEAARVLRANTEEAFMLGLVHDVGIPVLFQEIADIEADCGGTLHPATILQTVEANHARVGGMLFAHWSLPDRLAAVVREHHGPLALQTALGGILALACELADHALADEPGEPAESIRRIALRLGLYAADVDRLLGLAPSIRTRAETLA